MDRCMFFFFFFQAEDGIRDVAVTGVQTCALPILELSAVPQREEGMTPYELLLSESQERMLLVGAKGREDELRRVFAKWELDAVKIGEVTGGADLVVRHRGEEVAHGPVEALADAPTYQQFYGPAAWLAERQALEPLCLPGPDVYVLALLLLFRLPIIW